MKVTVHGVNYEGAHFRGIGSATDGRLVALELQGPERKIVDFIMENFGWGYHDDEPLTEEYIKEGAIQVHTMKALIEGMQTEHMLGMFDGAGGVLKIIAEDGTVLVDVTENCGLEDDGEPLKIGGLELKETDDSDTYYDAVNERLIEMFNAVTLPKREGDPEHNIYATEETRLQAAFPGTSPEQIERLKQVGAQLVESLQQIGKEQDKK